MSSVRLPWYSVFPWFSCLLRASSVFFVSPWFAFDGLRCDSDFPLRGRLALLAPRRPDQLTVHHCRRGDAEPVEHGGEEIDGAERRGRRRGGGREGGGGVGGGGEGGGGRGGR